VWPSDGRATCPGEPRLTQSWSAVSTLSEFPYFQGGTFLTGSQHRFFLSHITIILKNLFTSNLLQKLALMFVRTTFKLYLFLKHSERRAVVVNKLQSKEGKRTKQLIRSIRFHFLIVSVIFSKSNRKTDTALQEGATLLICETSAEEHFLLSAVASVVCVLQLKPAHTHLQPSTWYF